MVTTMILVFIVGYVLIALENKTGINKTAIALILGIGLWILYIFAGPALIINADRQAFNEFLHNNPAYATLSQAQQTIKYIINVEIINHLGDISEILFYLVGAMTIVELIDLHQGFYAITSRIKTRNKRKLLWLIASTTFLMSSVLDNMTSAIVMVILLQKLLDKSQERWLFSSMVVIAANAGGAWTPIGDVTTIMLWINDNITSGHIMETLFLPSIVSLAVPLAIVSLSLKGKVASSGQAASVVPDSQLSGWERNVILVAGILCLLFVPVFKALTNLPPFAGILLALGILWVCMELFYNRQHHIPKDRQYRVPQALQKIDWATILFFLGILMAVAALDAIGVLNDLSVFLDKKVHNVYVVSVIIGFLSSVVDNVPLVAAAMGMYPVLTPQAAAAMPEPGYMIHFIQNGTFWELLAYCAGTGGSILIIGSAAGVVTMGLEKINFLWYMKHISWLAIVGFFAGLSIYALQMAVF